MGKLENLSGLVKDKASQMKLNLIHLFSSETAKTIDERILKATSHKPNEYPSREDVGFLKSMIDTHYCPRTVAAIMQRLRTTTDVYVAAKCLVLIHEMLNSENGYLEENKHNYNHRHLIYYRGGSRLELNDLNVNSSSFTKDLSPWIQWYTEYLNCYISVADDLRVCPNIKDVSEEKRFEIGRVASYTNETILRQLDILVELFEHISVWPETLTLTLDTIVTSMEQLVRIDARSVMRLIKIRFEELTKREIKPDELIPASVRIEKCKESFRKFFRQCVIFDVDVWDLVSKLQGATLED